MLSACRPSLTASRKSSTFIVATPLPLRVVTSVDFSGVGASPAPFMAARWGYWYTLFSDKRAPVAQLDRASGYGPGGSGFESLRACQTDKRWGRAISTALFCDEITICFLRWKRRENF